MYIAGIDIGTTTISIVFIEIENKSLIASATIEHKSFLPGGTSEEKIQDAEKIWAVTKETLDSLSDRYGLPVGIGMTGQMHGMLYVDREGNAVSPLYTWQDGSGNIPLENGQSSAGLLKEKAGASAAGYGLATHFYLQKTEKIPENAVKMTTISDYVAMKLCGITEPVIGADMAASWGCFDLQKKEFLHEALRSAGVDISYLPEVRKERFIIGRTKDGIPVMGSAGDNQASFIGSVDTLYDTVLINVGTGSQVSFASGEYVACGGNLELRPCTADSYLLVGASLCGGRAYAMLEQFYREVSGTNESCYERMYEQAREFVDQYGMHAAWKVRTTFSGTREHPEEKGEMSGIYVENFHPGAMTAGVIAGILEELHGQYVKMCELTGKKAVRMVGSGNGIRRNPLMRRMAEEIFGLKMELPKYREEAAYGAALCMAGTIADKPR